MLVIGQYLKQLRRIAERFEPWRESLVTTMLAVGVLLSFARAEPTCAAALAARPSRVRGTLARLPIPFARRSTPTS